MKDQFSTYLSQKLEESLPGIEAQRRMAPSPHRLKYQVPDTARKAGVMVLLEVGRNQFNLILIQRAVHKGKDKHSGQISFPGGKYELDDLDMKHTALRETVEEIGISSGAIEVLGELSQLYIPVSNFLVFPYIGLIRPGLKMKREASEVAAILSIPFQDLHHTDNKFKRDILVGQNLYLKDVPYYLLQNHVVWGATAMMLSEMEVLTKDFYRNHM
jgi:8-oxo-dGTP pyrophosphatase MutT (NUDIX family)